MDRQPRKRDPDRSRADILDAAERLFAANGYEAVTMADIGAAAGLSRGTPGYFFGQKEQLYRVVLERAAATFRMLGETLRLRDAAGARPRDLVLKETIEAFVGLLAARRDVVRLLDRDGGDVVGAPHVEAVNDALASLGDARGPLALTVATLAWYPVSHPEAATVLGVDATADGFPAMWSAHILTLVGDLAERAGRGDVPVTRHAPTAVEPAPPTSPPATDGADDPDSRFVSEVVVGDRKKKKKKKKKNRPRDDQA